MFLIGVIHPYTCSKSWNFSRFESAYSKTLIIHPLVAEWYMQRRITPMRYIVSLYRLEPFCFHKLNLQKHVKLTFCTLLIKSVQWRKRVNQLQVQYLCMPTEIRLWSCVDCRRKSTTRTMIISAPTALRTEGTAQS